MANRSLARAEWRDRHRHVHSSTAQSDEFRSDVAARRTSKPLRSTRFDQPADLDRRSSGLLRWPCGHSDLTSLSSREQLEDVDAAVWPRTFARLRSMPQPVIAGQSMDRPGAEDARWRLPRDRMHVAAASAHVAQVEVPLGLIPGAGGTQWLPRLVGLGRATEIILSGRVVGAEEALAINLVEAVFPDEGFLDAVVAWSLAIATQPRHAMSRGKAMDPRSIRPSSRRGSASRVATLHEVPAATGRVAREASHARQGHARRRPRTTFNFGGLSPTT